MVGIQDLGAAGVACATTELAAAGTGGMLVRQHHRRKLSVHLHPKIGLEQPVEANCRF